VRARAWRHLLSPIWTSQQGSGRRAAHRGAFAFVPAMHEVRVDLLMVARRRAAEKGVIRSVNTNENDSRLLIGKNLIQFVAFRQTFKNNI
jgi:hypothetical protein